MNLTLEELLDLDLNISLKKLFGVCPIELTYFIIISKGARI